MATFISTGRLSGKLGDVVFRQVNGKTIVCSRPFSQAKSNDPVVLKRRAKFKLAVRLSSVLSRIPALKSIWREFFGNKINSVYYVMVKHFYNYVTHNSIADSLSIIPSFPSMTVENVELKVDTDKIKASCKVSEPSFGMSNIATVQMVGFIFIDDVIYSGLDKYNLYKIDSEKIEYSGKGALNIEVSLKEDTFDILKCYNSKKAFCILVAYDEENKIIGYSDTFTNG